MKRFKKVSSDLKTILKTDLPTLVTDLWFHELREGETRQSILVMLPGKIALR